SPMYSMILAPLRIGASAYTPRPWIGESRVSTSGDAAMEGLRRVRCVARLRSTLLRTGSRAAAREDERVLPRDLWRLFLTAMRVQPERTWTVDMVVWRCARGRAPQPGCGPPVKQRRAP